MNNLGMFRNSSLFEVGFVMLKKKLKSILSNIQIQTNSCLTLLEC